MGIGRMHDQSKRPIIEVKKIEIPSIGERSEKQKEIFWGD